MTKVNLAANKITVEIIALGNKIGPNPHLAPVRFTDESYQRLLWRCLNLQHEFFETQKQLGRLYQKELDKNKDAT